MPLSPSGMAPKSGIFRALEPLVLPRGFLGPNFFRRMMGTMPSYQTKPSAFSRALLEGRFLPPARKNCDLVTPSPLAIEDPGTQKIRDASHIKIFCKYFFLHYPKRENGRTFSASFW